MSAIMKFNVHYLITYFIYPPSIFVLLFYTLERLKAFLALYYIIAKAIWVPMCTLTCREMYTNRQMDTNTLSVLSCLLYKIEKRIHWLLLLLT